jgi:hypothetical protein
MVSDTLETTKGLFTAHPPRNVRLKLIENPVFASTSILRILGSLRGESRLISVVLGPIIGAYLRYQYWR